MHQDSSPFDLTTDGAYQSPHLVEMFSRQIGSFIGIGILVLIGLAAAALATWNVADPCLSYANDNPVTNVMGWPGAVFADIAMQFFGLASVAALLPPFFWAVLLIAQKDIGRLAHRIFFWLISAFCFSGVIALVPPFAHWPMPIGLGGVFGDKILNFAYLFLGSLPAVVSTSIIAAIFGPLAFWTAAIAGGVVGRRRLKKKVKSRRRRSDTCMVMDDDDEPARASLIVTVLGGTMHLFYLLRAEIGRIFHRREPMFPPVPDVRVSGYSGRGRVEPDFSAPSDEKGEMPFVEEEEIPQNEPQRKASPRQTDGFELPSVDFLAEPEPVDKSDVLTPEALKDRAGQLESVLEDFGVKGQIINARSGPVVTLFEFEPAPGIKSSRVIGLSDDIARSMSAISARVAVVPGRNVIGIELPNPKRQIVYLREIIATQDFYQNKAKLGLALGKTIGGEAVIADLAKMPHLLVAGTTGSGKSVAINTMILSLLYRMTPEQCRMIMVDPKMLELSVYDGIPHLLTPVVTDPKKAVVALKWAVREMEERYRKMAKVGVRNIDGFNERVKEAERKGEQLSRTVQTGFDHETGEPIYETETLDLTTMPYIVVIIDEMADLMLVAGKEIEGAIQRLAQMARAAGIHVIMATQRPSVDVITGTIKANFPTRISFQVTSKIDSRTILGEQGAEHLLGQGDMLFMMGGGRIQRVHGPFVGDEEVEQIVQHLKTQGVPDYLEAVTEESDDDNADDVSGGTSHFEDSQDPYDQAVAVVLRDRRVSTSYIQRRLGIGYNRAATIVERMEAEGLISPANHAGKREILVPEEGENF
ncbi:FtsK/SpoIIIE family DNA translocase [Bartonella apis]|uniref:DNA translocase FtsK n=1 Tax=Bartonella apis TaxID=1686310 RepID=A0A1R0FB73_9HYPH|nr:DNA translocase FtsK [Bartonella apis]MCT6824702.1 DNA translocase FtsK [Bartonella apis]MCT6886592.1 DNA translocase FtsK [Bartonella apis]OLY44236.1 DNA segregation ATPase FtsK/SpoIIIE, S-DNA-T family [Bartonella apis]OLY48770.1 DNA segregation ATPase FtsK/SpoIIIE, S-DNA-T family [Bartonella apis]